MSESLPGPTPYRVAYSGRVRDAAKQLMDRARERGLEARVFAAFKEIDRRLRIYPQFGDPLRDLVLTPARLWIGVVNPLVVTYLLDEDRRLVMVGVPIQPLPHTGLDP